MRARRSSQRKDREWFTFSASLLHHLCSDYISLRLLYGLEPLTVFSTTLVKTIEVAEKAMKLFIAVKTQATSALSTSLSTYGHNLEKLRGDCATHEPGFDDADIQWFTHDLNDKSGSLYQYLRYGSHSTIEGFSSDLRVLVPIVDKIFFTSILRLPPEIQRVLIFSCPLKHLVMHSQFDQSTNRTLVMNALTVNNSYIAGFAAYCADLDKDHAKLIQQFADIEGRT
jgi:hypothetical protein